jgi:hypothetical protein
MSTNFSKTPSIIFHEYPFSRSSTDTTKKPDRKKANMFIFKTAAKMTAHSGTESSTPNYKELTLHS